MVKKKVELIGVSQEARKLLDEIRAVRMNSFAGMKRISSLTSYRAIAQDAIKDLHLKEVKVGKV